MRIAIIGAGNIGGTLTRRLAALGHDVRVANSRAPETLKDLAAETGATATTAADGPKDADLVIISVPTKASPDLPRGAFDTRAPGAPIVETNNYYPGRDGHIDEIENGMASSRWVSNQIGQPVIKAFNTIYSGKLLDEGKPPAHPTGSRSRSPVTTPRRRRSSRTSSTSSDSTRSTMAASTTHGGRSRTPPSTAATLPPTRRARNSRPRRHHTPPTARPEARVAAARLSPAATSRCYIDAPVGCTTIGTS